MLWPIIVILLVIWLFGWIGFPILGWYVHMFLVAAIFVLLVEFVLSAKRAM